MDDNFDNSEPIEMILSISLSNPLIDAISKQKYLLLLKL